MKSVQDGRRDEPSFGRRGLGFGVGSWNPMDALVNAQPIVPVHRLSKDRPQVPLVPDEHSVETLSSERADQPFDVCLSIWRAVRDGDTSDIHCLEEPEVESGPARHSLAVLLNGCWPAQLRIFPVIVMDEKLRLLVESRIPNLLLHLPQRRMLRHVDMQDASALQLHDHENVECGEADGVLDEEIAGPNRFGLIPQEGPPRLRAPRLSSGLHHVLPDRRW